jgi:glycosyltransferase involved in cell wall biosynthesis
MNILIVSQFYYPEQFLINDIAPELVKQGHTVTVLTGLPNYPKGEVEKEYKFLKNRKQIIGGVKIIRCFEIGRRKSTLFLALNYLSYAISASIKALFLKEKFDVIFCYQVSPVTMGIPAIVYKKKNNVPFFLYCCDIFPESVKSHISSENNIAYKAIKLLSSYIYKQCDHIAVSSKPFTSYLEKVNGVSSNKLSYLPQHADDKYLNLDLTVTDNNCVDFIFAGNIGYGQNIDCIINAVEIIKEIPNFLVHIVGEGSKLAECKMLVDEKQLNNKFIFHGRYPMEEMPQFYKMADACLLTLRSNNFVSNTIPSKLQTYMVVGKPIIGAINGAAHEIINESNSGICVNSGDHEALAEAMKDFIINPIAYKGCGNNGRKFFKENFTKEIFMKSIGEIFNNLVEVKKNVQR